MIRRAIHVLALLASLHGVGDHAHPHLRHTHRFHLLFNDPARRRAIAR